MVNPIETLHDLAHWLRAVSPTPSNITVDEMISRLLQGPPDRWKKCRDSRCQAMLPATPEFFDRMPNNRDGLAHVCKNCRRQSHAAYTRRKRAEAKMNPVDLAEIQKHREAAGLSPLPFGPNAPPRGRPKNE